MLVAQLIAADSQPPQAGDDLSSGSGSVCSRESFGAGKPLGMHPRPWWPACLPDPGGRTIMLSSWRD